LGIAINKLVLLELRLAIPRAIPRVNTKIIGGDAILQAGRLGIPNWQ
jgi:hypothetical protein